MDLAYRLTPLDNLTLPGSWVFAIPIPSRDATLKRRKRRAPPARVALTLNRDKRCTTRAGL